ncbi:MAG: barstar family protein [Spirosomataceae bacterium]
MSNIVIINTGGVPAAFKKYRIGQIDGAKTPTLQTFYQAIEQALTLPDYFEYNLESLDDLLNDMSWIKQADVALCITHSDLFLSQEKPPKVFELINLLDAIAEDWKWVDEEEEIQSKNFKILFQHSARIIDILEKEEIMFEVA